MNPVIVTGLVYDTNHRRWYVTDQVNGGGIYRKGFDTYTEAKEYWLTVIPEDR